MYLCVLFCTFLVRYFRSSNSMQYFSHRYFTALGLSSLSCFRTPLFPSSSSSFFNQLRNVPIDTPAASANSDFSLAIVFIFVQLIYLLIISYPAHFSAPVPQNYCLQVHFLHLPTLNFHLSSKKSTFFLHIWIFFCIFARQKVVAVF